MLALKLTSPGVPDLYQGDELPLRALVDPDNRRPVDWDWYQAMLRRVMGGAPPDRDTAQAVAVRAARPAHPPRRSVRPGGRLHADGRGADVVAFTRGGEVLVAVAVRRDAPAGALPPLPGVWRDLLGGARRSLDDGLALARVLDAYGLAVLERVEDVRRTRGPRTSARCSHSQRLSEVADARPMRRRTCSSCSSPRRPR